MLDFFKVTPKRFARIVGRVLLEYGNTETSEQSPSLADVKQDNYAAIFADFLGFVQRFETPLYESINTDVANKRYRDEVIASIELHLKNMLQFLQPEEEQAIACYQKVQGLCDEHGTKIVFEKFFMT